MVSAKGGREMPGYIVLGKYEDKFAQVVAKLP
jgi:hypothetical protein